MCADNKKDALRASKNVLVDILELSGDSKNIDTITELLDTVDGYIRYIEIMDELESIKESNPPKRGKGFVYHLVPHHI